MNENTYVWGPKADTVCVLQPPSIFLKFILTQGLLLRREFTCCRLVSELG